jgi:hypothetical protein
MQWQDQYNRNEKGMTLMDLSLFLTFLEAIERICTCEKAKLESSMKASHKRKKGKKQPGTESTAKVPRKSILRCIATLLELSRMATYITYRTADVAEWLDQRLK